MTSKQALHADLAELQNHLTKLLIIEPRDMPAIIEAAEDVRRAEQRCQRGEGER